MSGNPLDQGNEEGDQNAIVAGVKELGQESDEEQSSTRSENAGRSFRAAVVGLVLLPLELFIPKGQTVFQVAFFLPSLILLPYSTLLLYQVIISKEKLERRQRRLAVLAGVLNFSILLFVFLFVVSLFLLPRVPRINPLDFHHPVEMVGKWESEDGAVEMELWKKGRLVFRAKGPPEIEFSGTWGLADFQFLFNVRRIFKGRDDFPYPQGQTLAWEYHHFSEKEIVFLVQKEEIRFIPKAK